MHHHRHAQRMRRRRRSAPGLVAGLVLALLAGLLTTPAAAVVNGDEVDDPTRWPWQVGIWLDPGDRQPSCGGAVVSPTLVVSAAHCFDTVADDGRYEDWPLASLRVVAGILHVDDPDGTAQERNVKAMHAHPGFLDQGSQDHDLALLELDRPLTFGDRVAPIEIWQDPSITRSTDSAVIAGWGTSDDGDQPDHMRQAEMPLLSDDACAEQEDAFTADLMLCAGGEGPDGCTGDSGGPLVRYWPPARTWVALGVSSFGPNPCGQDGLAGFYAELTGEHAEWLAGLGVEVRTEPVPAAFDGDPTAPQRLTPSTMVASSLGASMDRFGDGEAKVVVLSRDDRFPDALAASGLLRFGPMLFTRPDGLADATLDEIRRVLAPEGGAVIVGGPKAISPKVEQQLDAAGIEWHRAAGADRFETATVLARTLHEINESVGSHLLVARGFGPAAAPNGTAAWADAIAASAAAARDAHPMLLVPSDGPLPAAVTEFLADHGKQFESITVLGGPGAVSEAVYRQLGATKRISGAGRQETAVAIAQQLMGSMPGQAAEFVLVNGRHADGWGHGLAIAGSAADHDAPILLVSDAVSAATRRQVTGACGKQDVDLTVIGSTDVISQAVVDNLEKADGAAC